MREDGTVVSAGSSLGIVVVSAISVVSVEASVVELVVVSVVSVGVSVGA